MIQTSNLSTYLANGEPVYDVHFIQVTHHGETQLFAMRSPDDQRIGCAKFCDGGFDADIIGHRDAFLMISAGTPAFYHCGDMPADHVWTPLSLNRGHAVAA